jgi:probable lipoprotein NlpC
MQTESSFKGKQMTQSRLGILLVLILLMPACSTTKNIKAYDPIAKLIQEARTYTGTPYKWGGVSKSGIDCSGLVLQSFKAININLDRTADAQALQGQKIKQSELKPGDLVFFTKEKNTKAVTHVGLVTQVKNKEVIFINATTRKGVMESSLEEEYWRDRYWGARRIVKGKG